MCQANHTNPLFPTERSAPYCPSTTLGAASIIGAATVNAEIQTAPYSPGEQGATVAFESIYKTTNDLDFSTGKFYYNCY